MRSDGLAQHFGGLRIMGRFLEFFLHSQLKAMGWPRRKGVFRKQYVYLMGADAAITQGLRSIVGLGAGRPEVAVAMIADTFAGNLWTEESTARLIGTLREAEDIVAKHSDILPWQALWHDQRLASYSGRLDWKDLEELGWKDLFDDRLGILRAWPASQAAYWGLMHYQEMQTLLDRERCGYEKSAIEGRKYGLEVSDKYPFESLERFYEWCDTLILHFEEVLSPLPSSTEIPANLKAVPEIAKRIAGL